MSRDGTVTRRPNLRLSKPHNMLEFKNNILLSWLQDTNARERGSVLEIVVSTHIFVSSRFEKCETDVQKQKSSGSARVSTRANYKFLNLHFVFSLLFYSYHLQFVANKQYFVLSTTRVMIHADAMLVAKRHQLTTPAIDHRSISVTT
jgi:hypothetical protein